MHVTIARSLVAVTVAGALTAMVGPAVAHAQSPQSED